MTGKIDKGRSMLNAADETANPYGLILSEQERDVIYGLLNSLDKVTNALLCGKTGRKQQVEATVSTGAEVVGIGIAAIVLHHFANISPMLTFVSGSVLLMPQKLNLLLTHERLDDTIARRLREHEKEAKKRAQYFKEMGTNDISLEE
jgi:hypothetical protein